MRSNLEEATRICVEEIKQSIEQMAEQNAELYVSSTLAMEEGEEKRLKKEEYKDNFTNLVISLL